MREEHSIKGHKCAKAPCYNILFSRAPTSPLKGPSAATKGRNGSDFITLSER